MEKEVNRILRSFCSVPNYTVNMTTDQVDLFLDLYDTIQFCQGRARKIVFDKITEKHYKAKSEPV